MRTSVASFAPVASLASVAVLACCVAVLTLGCTKDTAAPAAPTAPTAAAAEPPTAAPVEQPADERVTAADQACTQDRDCALTTADCCGCNALGKQIGVRADRMAALAQRRSPVCAGVSCAQAMSEDPSCGATKAVCREGTCQPNVGAAAAPKPTPVEPIPPG